jgi:hypothetical protein
VNSLAASIALKKNLMVSEQFPPISKQRKENTMKFTTIALTIALALPSTYAFARGGLGSSHVSSFGGAGRMANKPRNASGNSFAPIAHDPSGSTLTGSATNRTGG